MKSSTDNNTGFIQKASNYYTHFDFYVHVTRTLLLGPAAVFWHSFQEESRHRTVVKGCKHLAIMASTNSWRLAEICVLVFLKLLRYLWRTDFITDLRTNNTH